MSNNTDDSRHPIIWCIHLYFSQFKSSSKSKCFDFFGEKLWWTGFTWTHNQVGFGSSTGCEWGGSDWDQSRSSWDRLGLGLVSFGLGLARFRLWWKVMVNCVPWSGKYFGISIKSHIGNWSSVMISLRRRSKTCGGIQIIISYCRMLRSDLKFPQFLYRVWFSRISFREN